MYKIDDILNELFELNLLDVEDNECALKALELDSRYLSAIVNLLRILRQFEQLSRAEVKVIVIQILNNPILASIYCNGFYNLYYEQICLRLQICQLQEEIVQLQNIIVFKNQLLMQQQQLQLQHQPEFSTEDEEAADILMQMCSNKQ